MFKKTLITTWSVISLILILLPLNFFSQKYVEPANQKQFNITVNLDDYTVKTQMLSQNKEIKVKPDRTYMWYSTQKIMETKGGFDGKLIHGKYSEFYLNNQLKQQGQIKYGLKNKEWKYWYPDGKLKEIINWKNGVKDGSYNLYNDYGQLMAKGNFKEDKLHGKFFTYGTAGNIIEKKKYKNGEEVIPAIKSPKTIRKKREPEKDNNVNTDKKKTSIFKRIFKKKKSKVAQPEVTT